MHDSIIPSEPTIQRGICYAIFAYDAARAINLADAERRVQETTQRDTIRHKRRTPSYFEYQPPPLRVSRDRQTVSASVVSPRRPNLSI